VSGFNVAAAACVLVVATDGLWKYAGRFYIADVAAFRPLEDAAAALVDGVRLKSGALQGRRRGRDLRGGA
jgi:hypothetical protein